MADMSGARTRYSAWTGAQSIEVLGAEDVLDALSDGLLSEGIDQTVNKALHQGIRPDEGADVPGLDQLRDRLRSLQRSTTSELAAEIDDTAFSDALAAFSDDDLQRLVNALRANAPTFPGMLDSASPALRAKLEGLLQSAAPADGESHIKDTLDQLVDLSRLESSVRSVRDVDDISRIDPDMLQRLLGEEARENLLKLAGSLREFSKSGYVQFTEGRAGLSARAVQKIGEALLQATLSRLSAGATGEHSRRSRGYTHHVAGTVRDYEFGDPFELDLSQTVLGAVKRHPGTPVQLSVRDMKVIEREPSERATTVLAIDLSRSMAERGYLLAAKRLALALSTFIRIRYPHDELLLIGFSESARRIHLQELVALQWDRYGYGTNVHDALRLATGVLGSHRGRKRNVVLITDGEPTAHREPNGQVVFNHPPSEQTVARTVNQARQLGRDGIYLCVCLMSADARVTTFGTELARYSSGDLIVTDPERLSADLFVTYGQRRSY